MWPFTLSGPSFLLFYAIFAALVLFAATRVRVAVESGNRPRLTWDDPYLIAYLRGGPNEALRVASVSLIDRGLLSLDGDRVVAARGAAEHAQRPLDRALLLHFHTAAAADTIFDDRLRGVADDAYEARLAAMRLLPDDAQRAERRQRIWWVLGLLLGLAAFRVARSLATGHPNVIFLVVLAVLVTFVTCRVLRPRVTALGATVLDDLRTLFASLRHRAASIRPGGHTSEAVLLAAVFGVGMLPAAGFPYVKQLYPRAASDGGGSGSSCGSSCGSSGDGGGSGCGGCGGGGD